MNFENPTPTSEIEPRYPSLEEIQSKIESITGKANIEVIQTLEDVKGTSLYEVSIVDENGDAACYVYRRAGEKSAETEISVEYYTGPLEDDTCIGGEGLAVYDESVGRWTDKSRNEIKQEHIVVQAWPISSQYKEITDFPNLITTLENTPKDALSVEQKDEALKFLENNFSRIENQLGTLNVEDIQRSELENPQKADAVRSQSLPLQREINNTLMAFNRSKGTFQTWNPNGHLTQDEFDTLNLRRKRIDNAIGSKVMDPFTFQNKGIRHDIHEV
jgi:hypothetical protein